MKYVEMKAEHRQVIRELRSAGYAVIVWSPEELGDPSAAKHVEDRSIEVGHQVIDELNNW